jgi:hypothetical protein
VTNREERETDLFGTSVKTFFDVEKPQAGRSPKSSDPQRAEHAGQTASRHHEAFALRRARDGGIQRRARALELFGAQEKAPVPTVRIVGVPRRVIRKDGVHHREMEVTARRPEPSRGRPGVGLGGETEAHGRRGIENSGSNAELEPGRLRGTKPRGRAESGDVGENRDRSDEATAGRQATPVMGDRCGNDGFFEGSTHTGDGVEPFLPTRRCLQQVEGDRPPWSATSEAGRPAVANPKRCEPCLARIAKHPKRTRTLNRRGREKRRGWQSIGSMWWCPIREDSSECS